VTRTAPGHCTSMPAARARPAVSSWRLASPIPSSFTAALPRIARLNGANRALICASPSTLPLSRAPTGRYGCAGDSATSASVTRRELTLLVAIDQRPRLDDAHLVHGELHGRPVVDAARVDAGDRQQLAAAVDERDVARADGAAHAHAWRIEAPTHVELGVDAG